MLNWLANPLANPHSISTEMKQINLLTDHAIGEDRGVSQDGLGFKAYASVLAEAAIGTQGPFTIGVFGEWGTGKTSLMRLIQTDLDTRQEVITVWFNAWRYENEEHPVVPLVGTIIHSLERHKPFLNRLSDGGELLINTLRAVAYGFSAKSKVEVPGVAEIEATFAFKDVISREEHLTQDPLLDRSLYYEVFERLSALKFPSNTKIVVIIDDLDRCFPDRAIKLLESIKLVLSQPGFIFILGVSRRVIEGYLQHRYAKEYGITNFEGQLYLDKIVQLPFHIPPNLGRMDEFSENILNRVSKQMRETLIDILPIIGSASGGNPRSIIRFVNNLLIDIGINEMLVSNQSMKIIPVEYFAITRCLQQRWPNIYSSLVGSNELCQIVLAWDSEALRRAASSSERENSDLAEILLSEPELLTLLQTSHGYKWLSNNATRSEAIQFLNTQRQDGEAEQNRIFKRFDFYISCSSEKVLQATIDALLEEKYTVTFLDKWIRIGDNIYRDLPPVLRQCKTMIFIIGEDEFEINKKVELDLAIQLSKIDKSFRIIPALINETHGSKIPEQLEKFENVTLSYRPVSERQLILSQESLISILRKLV
ncbi:TIR domain-containing protein [Acaryochloris sp. 'Moss Beach']|uniref:P-loop NTPase fold protein n=1 Tax=Acaryochloris sp. 'Moss Beach' TaxID=2740837 RepID=UPI001F48E910|nr:P-loop NTPase fold protein [Acaryochloris sp. 'Moss Beach']UJB70334.1 TIR domain-containing protein [Acaryochloris sp. 'Moss Beach']